MANVASSSNTAMAGIDFSHSVFSAQVVNRRAYGRHTWVLDISATYHFICSVDLLTTITATMQSLVQLPNGESAQVTHIGIVVLSSSLTLKNVLCVPSFTLTFYLLVQVLNLNHTTLFFFYLGKRLGWERQLMDCTCCSVKAFSILLVLP